MCKVDERSNRERRSDSLLLTFICRILQITYSFIAALSVCAQRGCLFACTLHSLKEKTPSFVRLCLFPQPHTFIMQYVLTCRHTYM